MVQNKRPRFEFVQSSQYAKASPQKLETGTDSILEGGASILALTEVFTEQRSERLQEKGYAHHHKPGADCGLIWDTDDWVVLYQETVEVTKDFYFAREGRKRKPQKAVFVVLQHKVTAHILLIIVNHFPPHVEGSGGPGRIWRPEMVRRWTATISAIRGIKKVRRKLRKTFKPDAEVLTGDWNLNIMRAAVRAWFAIQFPRMRPNFPEKYEGLGTLGKRVVDFSLLRGLEIVDGPEVRSVVSSDHRFARTILRFIKPPRRVLS